jgi:glyoxylase-like metal-dependent hydrolase (beta-lactamase superfamily II)
LRPRDHETHLWLVKQEVNNEIEHLDSELAPWADVARREALRQRMDELLQGIDPDLIRGALREERLSDTAMTLDQNAVLLRHGDRLALVDTGTGGDPLFGSGPGQLLSNLRAAGIDPAAITDVLLTHGHPDHLWGLTDPTGALHFPNAQVHLSEADYRFFADPAQDGHPLLGPFMAKCRANLAAAGDRLHMMRDGQEVLPGVVAMAAPGHTPGHTVYRLQSGDEVLLLAGDLAHHHVIFPASPRCASPSTAIPRRWWRRASASSTC